MGNGAIVTLSGGAQASNVFWQVAGEVTLIAMITGAIMTGCALAQTAVTLDATAITQP